ncbi:ParA family protein [Erythrobacteraceae bacterium CFH 75059]|uniref:ParA family protein n=1 Tax=Qipengyuania thermophila TaxID=2509361 RepID=UPI0010208567|nr:ParA family protein [Qipengyuania thermophila]TCD02082.1 ParA family protein [Erythrobacteraceae bacterium CFH 75059]
MATIAVYSVKGGVGKTTLAANLAWSAATVSSRRTLLWDLDPSGGAGFLLGIDRAGDKALRIFDDEEKAARAVVPTSYARLSLLPSDESLRELDQRLTRIGKRKRLLKLARALSAEHERIILDCPPVLGEVGAQILRAADVVVVPLPPSPLSLRALDTVTDTVRDGDGRTPVIVPVLSMLDARRSLHRATRDEHPDWPVIPFASVLEQCAVRRQPVGAFARHAPAAQAVNRVWVGVERALADSRNGVAAPARRPARS